MISMINVKLLADLLEQAPVVTEKQERKYITPELKEEVLIRDNHTCQVCGRCKELKIHHIIPYGESTKDNLVVVCGYCHEYIHKILKRKGYQYVSPVVAMRFKK